MQSTKPAVTTTILARGFTGLKSSGGNIPDKFIDAAVDARPDQERDSILASIAHFFERVARIFYEPQSYRDYQQTKAQLRSILTPEMSKLARALHQAPANADRTKSCRCQIGEREFSITTKQVNSSIEIQIGYALPKPAHVYPKAEEFSEDNPTDVQEFVQARTIVLENTTQESFDTMLSLLGDTSPAIDFEPMRKQLSERREATPYLSSRFIDLPSKYRDGNYRHHTVEAYKLAKKYPSERDVRPPEFDPNGKDVCAHGTNFSSVIQSLQHTNLQLVSGIKKIKLTGKLPETGESTGITVLNRSRVSTVSLSGWQSYGDVLHYAKQATTSFNQSRQPDSRIPVVVFGDGVVGERVRSDIPNEVAYKRVNIRMLAVEDDAAKQSVTQKLRALQASTNNPEIGGIRLCTFAEIGAEKRFDGRWIEERTTSFQSLWEKAKAVGEQTA